MNHVATIMSLVGCTEQEAERALLQHETVIEAVDSLLGTAPYISGSKYIPKKPTIKNELDEEQAQRCAKGRDLQDKVNAVFSVAHSKTLSSPPPAGDGQRPPTPVPAVEEFLQLAVPESSEREQDSHGQTTQ